MSLPANHRNQHRTGPGPNTNQTTHPGRRPMELGAEGRKPLDLLGSASRTSSLRNKRPSTQTKSVDPRAQPLLPHTDKQQEKDVSAHVAMFLVDVSLLNTKQMRSRMLTSFCQLHKKNDQNTYRHKKSLHQDMVCLFK